MGFAALVESWRDGVRQHEASGDPPEDFMLAWIQVESGGHMPHRGSSGYQMGEYGLYEVSRDESHESLGLDDAQHDRQATDADWSLKQGRRLAVRYIELAGEHLRDAGADWDDWDTRALAKQRHAYGAWAMLSWVTKTRGRAPQDFAELARVVRMVGGNVPKLRADACMATLATTENMIALARGTPVFHPFAPGALVGDLVEGAISLVADVAAEAGGGGGGGDGLLVAGLAALTLGVTGAVT